jgi:hypothetical protein
MKDASLCVRAWTISAKAVSLPSNTALPAGAATIGEISTQVAKKLGLSEKALESMGCYTKLPDKSPNKAATREEFAYILAKALQLPTGLGKSPVDIGSSFARTAIVSLVGKKITSIGKDGIFNPTQLITRADVDKWLDNAVSYKEKSK